MTIKWIAADLESVISHDLRIVVMHDTFMSTHENILTQHIIVAKNEVIKCQ